MDLRESIAELERLREEWLRTDGRRAAGARLALSGFHYQLASTLLDRVSSWCDLPKDRRGTAAVFDEQLSDAVKVTSDEIVVTQSKRSVSGTSLRKALDELWSVHQARTRLDPPLARAVRYQVRTSRLAAAPPSLDGWAPAGMAADAPEVRDFRARLSLSHAPDPERELLALLANRLRDRTPLDTLERWLGLLLRAGTTDDALPFAAGQIWQDLWTLEEARALPGGIVMWTAEDVPPREVRPGEYLTGERPLLWQLRQGYFASRTEVYGRVTAQLHEWILSDPARKDRSARLPVFWIGGRSGSGKSVALLHVLAMLYEEGFGPILWLGDKVGNLPQAMECARAFARRGIKTLIALDDPFSPSAQANAQEIWREALDGLEALRQTGEVEEIPLVVCCGPTEQGERFEEEFRDDVRVTLTEVPQETHLDLADLRGWFRARTGRQAPELGDVNVLLVQLFFEWRVNVRIPEFARRLRLRILDEDPSGAVLELFSSLLAANRLYVGLPPDAVERELSPERQRIMERLRGQAHLVDDLRAGRRELWLAHPHLSNAIYESWYPAGQHGPVRAAHLRSANRISLAHGHGIAERTALLWAISRALRVESPASREVVGRLDREELPALLGQLHGDTRALLGDGDLPLWLLPVWVALQARCAPLRLVPDPVAMALEQLVPAKVDETGFRLTCHILLQHLAYLPERQARAAVDGVMEVLQARPGWREWEPVARDALLRTGDPRLVGLLTERARRHPGSRRSPRLLIAAMSLFPGDARLEACVTELLPDAPADVAWGDAALALWEQAGTARPPAAVVEWASRQRRELCCCFVLGRMLRVADPQWPAWGFAWAGLWHLERIANYVLEPLVEIDPGNGSIVSWSRRWIAAGHPASGFLMESLLKHRARDPEIVALGESWLRATPRDPSWTYVWALLREVTGDAALARELAHEWLANAPSVHASWVYTWTAQWETGEARDALWRLGLEWLERAPPSHGSWFYLWEHLWNTGERRDEVTRQALAWLAAAPGEHGSWVFLWSVLWKAETGAEALRAVGVEWLARAPAEHGSWVFLWLAIWETGVQRDVLAGLGTRWLASAPAEHGSWKYLWERLWETGETRDALRELGLSWLSRAPAGHGSWKFVWEALWEAGEEREALHRLGLEWLEQAPAEHGSWKFVWEALWEAGERREELLRLGRAWLSLAPAEHGSWHYVWNALWEAGERQDELCRLGREWLERAPAEHGAWKFVWEQLWKAGESPDAMRRVGLEWLRTAPAEHGSWVFLWTTLWETGESREPLHRLGLDWLGDAPAEHGSWLYLWDQLWDAGTDRDELRRLAALWMENAPPRHGSWWHLWNRLWRAGLPEEELMRLGLAWLAKAPADHLSWVVVWNRLWGRRRQVDQVRQVGMDWLRRVPGGHPAWHTVWTALWSVREERDTLAELGVAYLRVNRDTRHAGPVVTALTADGSPALRDAALSLLRQDEPTARWWSVLWKLHWDCGDGARAEWTEWLMEQPLAHANWARAWLSLWEQSPGSARLAEAGLRFLRDGPGRNPLWVLVWIRVREAYAGGPDDARAEVAGLGVRWMSTDGAGVLNWPMVWLPLWEDGAQRDVLRDLAESWLPAPAGYLSTWEAVWDAARDGLPPDEAVRRGLAWLKALPHDHRGWGIAWSRLWAAGADRELLIHQGMEWMETASPNNRMWGAVWLELSATGHAPERVHAAGVRWLEAAPTEHAAWPFVWDRLRPRLEPAEARDLAERWLREAAEERRASPLPATGGAPASPSAGEDDSR